MKFSFINDFFAYYGLSSLCIAIISATITCILKKFLVGKKSERFLVYLPFIISIIFELAFDMIFNLKKFAITENAIFLGVITASISTVLVKLLGKIKRGEFDEKQVLTAILVAIDSLPLGDKKFSIASRILKLIITSDLNQVEDSIVNCLSENSCESQSKIKKVAEKILQSVKKDTI